MNQKVFADRFPWKLLNWRSPESQRAWLERHLPKGGSSIRLPVDGALLKERWVFLSASGDGWPAVGNALNAWPGRTTLFAPPSLSSAFHFGCSFRVVDPADWAVGGPVFDELLVRSVESPPGTVLLLDREPPLPLLYLIAKTEAPLRVGFGSRDFSPFCNFRIASDNASDWAALLAKWMKPGPGGRRLPNR